MKKISLYEKKKVSIHSNSECLENKSSVALLHLTTYEKTDSFSAQVFCLSLDLDLYLSGSRLSTFEC